MKSARSENMSWDTKKAIEELVRGRELTNQLRDLLSKSLGDEGLVSSEDLVMKICNSFANTLSMLRNSGDYDDDDNEVLQKPRNNNNNLSWDGRKSEDSGESIKSTTSTQKDRRGCYKRRKCADESWTRDAPTLTDDGHAWRKYGQKQILNANHPRNYFRCTHKTDGCQATKQVQKIEDDPPKYRTIYYGHHTCKNMLKPASQLILDHSTSKDSSVLLSFANNNLTNKQDNPFFSSFPSVKQESKEDYMPSDVTYNRSSSSEYLLSSDHLTTFDLSAQMTVLLSDVDSVDVETFLSFDG